MVPRTFREVSVTLLLALLLPRGCWSFVQPLRFSSVRQQEAIRTRSSRCVNMRSEGPTELAVDRGGFIGAALGAAALLTTVAAAPKKALAIELPEMPELPFGAKELPEEEAKMVKVAGYSRFVDKLEQDLRSGALKGGADDSAVVLRVLEAYLKPMQESMLKVAPMLQLAGRGSRERARLLPLLMQGHLLELEMACGTKNAKDQLKEVQEVKETLDEFVALAKTRYDIVLPPVQSAPDGDQMGIFGCTFFGMKRTDGSNTCEPDP